MQITFLLYVSNIWAGLFFLHSLHAIFFLPTVTILLFLASGANICGDKCKAWNKNATSLSTVTHRKSIVRQSPHVFTFGIIFSSSPSINLPLEYFSQWCCLFNESHSCLYLLLVLFKALFTTRRCAFRPNLSLKVHANSTLWMQNVPKFLFSIEFKSFFLFFFFSASQLVENNFEIAIIITNNYANKFTWIFVSAS